MEEGLKPFPKPLLPKKDVLDEEDDFLEMVAFGPYDDLWRSEPPPKLFHDFIFILYKQVPFFARSSRLFAFASDVNDRDFPS